MKQIQIIADTREQLPVFNANTIRRALKEGDYSIEGLENHLVLERKSPGDLYQSILQNHDRFKREIYRATIKGKKFYILVECKKEIFLSMMWSDRPLRARPMTLAKIINTIEQRYGIVFVWCHGRDVMKEEIKRILKEYYQNIFHEDIEIISG